MPQLALGVLLSGLAALGFVLFNAASVQRVPVLALAPGQYPTPRLAIGDLVSIMEVSDELAVLVEAAEVVGIEPVGTQGQRFVSLQTGEADASVVAQAAAIGEVRLVLIARDAAGGEVGG